MVRSGEHKVRGAQDIPGPRGQIQREEHEIAAERVQERKVSSSGQTGGRAGKISLRNLDERGDFGSVAGLPKYTLSYIKPIFWESCNEDCVLEHYMLTG